MKKNALFLLAIIASLFPQMVFAQSSIDFVKLREKANEQYKKGYFSKAISLVETAIDLYDDLYEKKDSLYAFLLSDLALYKYNGGDYEEAIRIEEIALQLKIEQIPSNTKSIVKSYNNLCDYYCDSEEYEKAIECGLNSIRILNNDKDEGELYLEALENLGVSYIEDGRLDEAKSVLEKALSLIPVYTSDYPILTAEILTSIGYLYEEYGLYIKALDYAKKGQDIFIESHNDDHPNYSYSLNTLGIIYTYLGDYHSALESMSQCALLREKYYGIGHQYHISALTNLGAIYDYCGNYEMSLRLFEQALSLKELKGEKDDARYSFILANIANSHAEKGNLKEAIEAQSQVVAIEKNVYGTHHPHYAREVLYLSDYYRLAKDYSKAISLGEEALSLVRRDLPANYFFYRYIAESYCEAGIFSKAVEYIDTSLELLSQLEGSGTVMHRKTSRSKLHIYSKAGLLSVKDVTEYDESLRYLIVHNFPNMTSSQRTQLWLSVKEWFTKELPQYATEFLDDSLSKRLYNDVLLTKGITLNSAIEFNKQILETNNPELKELYDDLSNTSQLITSLLRLPITERYLSVDSLYTRRDVLEKQLIEESQVYGNYMRNLELDWTSVQSGLNPDEIAIEFIDFPTEDNEQEYYAILIKKGYTAPVLRRLCSSTDIKNASGNAIYTSTALFDLIWAPVFDLLHNTRRIYFSPTGQLFNIAIEYLSSGIGGQSLTDLYEMYRLSSTRLIALSGKGLKSGPNNSKDIYAFGGIEYGNTDKHTNRDTTSIRSGFNYLPATKEEVEIVRLRMKNRFKITLFTGGEATETVIKNLSGKPMSCLHIATHGFYWTDNDIRKNNLDYDFMCVR